MFDKSSASSPDWEPAGDVVPIEATIDSVGRVVVPKQLRDALGLAPGSTVDISVYDAGLQLVPVGRTARSVTVEGTLMADSATPITDETVFGQIDSSRGPPGSPASSPRWALSAAPSTTR